MVQHELLFFVFKNKYYEESIRVDVWIARSFYFVVRIRPRNSLWRRFFFKLYSSRISVWGFLCNFLYHYQTSTLQNFGTSISVTSPWSTPVLYPFHQRDFISSYPISWYQYQYVMQNCFYQFLRWWYWSWFFGSWYS